MPVLELFHSDTFTAEMNRLRCECFATQYQSGEARDEFDGRSTHVCVRVGGALAGYGRLTPGPDSWFEYRSRGPVAFPTGSDVVDFGRVMVAPGHRGHDLFELVLLDGLLWACDRGFPVVVGSSGTGRGFRPFIHGLGFADAGPAVELAVGRHHAELEQPVTAATAGRRPEWSARKGAVIGRLRDKGCEVVDRGCPVDRPE